MQQLHRMSETSLFLVLHGKICSHYAWHACMWCLELECNVVRTFLGMSIECNLRVQFVT